MRTEILKYGRIRDIRNDRGLTQKQIAEILHVSQNTYSQYEIGTSRFPLDVVVKLAEFYDVTTDYLLGRTEYRCPPEALRRRVAIDFTVQDIINTVLELKPEARNSVVDFVKYMKHLYGEPLE